MEGLRLQLACPPTPQSRDHGVHGYLTWEAAYLSLNGGNLTVACVPFSCICTQAVVGSGLRGAGSAEPVGAQSVTSLG